MTKFKHIKLPAWFTLDNPNGGTLEFLQREYGNAQTEAERAEYFDLIQTTEKLVEHRRRSQIK